MKSVPVLLITHDDLLWQRWRARSRALAGCPRARAGRPAALARPGPFLAVLDADLPRLPSWQDAAWAQTLAGLSLLVASASPTTNRAPRSWPRAPKATATATPAAGAGTGPGGHLHGRHLDGPFPGQPPAAPGGRERPGRRRLGWRPADRARDHRRPLRGRRLGHAQIAEALGITERTVKAHLSAVFEKLGVSDRLQLALLVHGISSPSESRSKIPPELSSRTIPRPAGLL